MGRAVRVVPCGACAQWNRADRTPAETTVSAERYCPRKARHTSLDGKAIAAATSASSHIGCDSRAKNAVKRQHAIAKLPLARNVDDFAFD